MSKLPNDLRVCNSILFDEKRKRIINLNKFYVFEIVELTNNEYSIEGFCAPSFTKFTVKEDSKPDAIMVPDAVSVANFTNKEDAEQFLSYLFEIISKNKVNTTSIS